jgi:uncharacterized protein
MAMTMSGEVALPADRMTVWTALNDPEVLKRCIPGTQELVKVSDTEFQATVRAAVGPVKAIAKGGASVRLADADGGGTLMAYDVEANVGGKLAQLGGRLINGVAKKYADEFFANFAKVLAGEDVK